MKRLCGILFFVVVLVSTMDLYAEKPKKDRKKSEQYPEFTRADSLHGFLNKFRLYDVQFYDIDIDVNPQSKYLKGSVSMDFIWKGGGVGADGSLQMQLDLSSVLIIDSIYIDNQKTTVVNREYNAVMIAIPNQLDVDSKHTLTCWYQGKPAEAVRPPWEGGMVWKTSSSGKPWFGVTCETLGASCWIPCKDHLSDEPDFGMRMKVAVPKGLTVVSNGSLQSHETINDKEVWTWQTNYSINSYNITFYAGDYMYFGEEYQGVDTTFTLNYYVLPEDEAKARKSFEQSKTVLASYEDFYGPYPWPKDGFCLVESPYEGMEHQTAIAYGNGFKNTFGMDYIIVHETAHEWWGNCVSVDDYAEIFIHEGFAMYSEFLYVERMFGKEKSDTYARAWKSSMSNIRPVVGPRDVNFWDYHDSDAYIKGAWTLKGLRYLIANDSLFFDILKSYYMSRRYQIVTVKDFTDFVYEKTGTDYSWYFKQYLYSEKVPELQWRWIPITEIPANKEKVNYILDETTQEEELAKVSFLQLRWTNVDDDFVMPISITTRDSSGAEVCPKIYVGNGLRTQRVENVPVTTKGVIIKRYGNTQADLYFERDNAYFTMKNIKKFK